MLVLALDASASCAAALVENDSVRAEYRLDGPRQTAALPDLVRRLLAEGMPDLVGVTVGPGSFTGLRAALSLAHGIGLGLGVPVIGVTVAEALADALPALGGRCLWVALGSGRGRVFLDTGDGMGAVDPRHPPPAAGRIALAGDAAISVAASLAARGDDIMLTDARRPLPRHVAVVARRRHVGELSPLAAQPLYVDPPEARAMPQRPAPA